MTPSYMFAREMARRLCSDQSWALTSGARDLAFKHAEEILSMDLGSMVQEVREAIEKARTDRQRNACTRA